MPPGFLHIVLGGVLHLWYFVVGIETQRGFVSTYTCHSNTSQHRRLSFIQQSLLHSCCDLNVPTKSHAEI